MSLPLPRNIDLRKYPDQALIREADGLTAAENLILHIVASHKDGRCFASVETLRDWTGLSRNHFYKARKSLLARGLISETRNPGGSTTYRLRKRPLQLLAQQGIARRRRAHQQRAVARISAPREVMPGVDTTHPARGERVSAQNRETGRVRSGDGKRNNEQNTEEIKNMKKIKKVKPARAAELKRDPSARVETHVELGTGDAFDMPALGASQESIRSRIAQYRERWGDL